MFVLGAGMVVLAGLLFAAIYYSVADYVEIERLRAESSGLYRGIEIGKAAEQADWIEKAIERGFGHYNPRTGEFEWFSKGDLLRECEATLKAGVMTQKEIGLLIKQLHEAMASNISDRDTLTKIGREFERIVSEAVQSDLPESPPPRKTGE